MAFEEDFKEYGIIELNVKSRVFKIKQFTPAELDRIADKSSVIVEDNGVSKTKFSMEEQNAWLLVEGVIEAPWVIDGVKWKELNSKKKYDLFKNKIDAEIRKELLKAIGGANTVEELKKK